MSGISKQVGWSNEANLLYEILKEMKRLQSITSKLSSLSFLFTTHMTLPSVNDDITLGYQPGAEWLDLTTGYLYKLIDATAGAAVWKEFQFVNLD